MSSPEPLGKTPEPAMRAAVTAAAASALGTAVAFGVPITDEQRVAVLGLVAAVGILAPLLAGRFTRARVRPLRTTARHDGR